MIQLLGHELLSRIALTLMHFLWQGVAIGAVAAIAASVLHRSSASSRYALYTVALLCLPACVAVTLATVEIPDAWRDYEAEVAGQTVSRPMTKEPEASTEWIASSNSPQPNTFDDLGSLRSHSDRSKSSEPVVAESHTAMPDKRADATPPPLFARLSPAIVLAYVAGASLCLLRLMAGTWGGHRLRVASTPIDDPSLLKLVAEQSRKVGLRIVPAVAVCERVAVPMVVGVLRPVVLLPMSIVTGLAPEQFAAIMSHELAHIRRFDLLMNLLQRLIESLLFFHPVVWYISRRMSAEREACCDDLVVSSGYAPMDYAGALLRMAELCSPAGQSGVMAVAASGHNATQFELRIQRLMNRPADSRLRLTRVGVIMIALLMISVAVTPAAFRNWAQAQDEGRLQQVEASAAANSELQEASENRTVKLAAASITGSPIDVKLKLIEAGNFLMGSPANQKNAESDETPQHGVRISKAFLLGQTEVTQDQWEAVMGTTPWKGKQHVKEGAGYAATHVAWEDAVAFCERLSRLEGKKYRLPTEAEWEYACRAGTLTNYSFGDEKKKLGDYAWCGQNTKGEQYAHRVATKLPNAWGLYDMHGNVSEYCQDWYGKYDEQDAVDPLLSNSTPSSLRVMRGGHWLRTSKWCRSAERDPIGLSSTSSMWGFRVVREVEQLTAAAADEAGGLRSPKVHKTIEGAADGNQCQGSASSSPDGKPENEKRKQASSGEPVNVLLVDRTPRWSFRYLQNVLQRDETIEVKSVLMDAAEVPDVLPRFLDYDVIVLGDVEPASLGRNNVENIERFVRDYGRALILIAGDTHLPWSYADSPLAPLFPIDLKTTSRPDEGVVQPIVPQGMRELPMFQLGKDDDARTDVIQNLPKLSVKAEVNGLKTGAEVWVSSSQGEDQTPLIARWKYGIGDVVFLATDEIWRWRTTEDGEDVHNHFWTKTMRYLARTKRDGDQPGTKNTVELDAETLKAFRIKHFLEALTDRNTEPIWGEAVNGLQAGVVGIRDGQRFQAGANLRFALLLRNTSNETIRFEYQWPENCFWIAPSVETLDGERVPVVAANFRGGHKQFTETLDPDAVSLVMLQGMLGLGEEGRSTQWSPYIENPQPARYRLGAGVYPYLVDSDGKRVGKAFFLASGFVNFEMTAEDETKLQPPPRDAVRSRIELYEESFRLQTELANGLPTTREGIERVFQRALGRKPTDDELSTTLKSVLQLLSKDPQLQKQTKMTRALQEWLRAGIEGDTPFDKFVREQLSEGAEGSVDEAATEPPEAAGLLKDDFGANSDSSPYPWPDQLFGTVSDTEGNAIAEADVKLTIEEHFRDGTDYAKRILKTFQATTQANGKYTFDTTGWPSPSIEREYSVTILASAPGAAPWETWLYGTKGDREMPESLPGLKLPAGRLITGRCVDASGEPVSGVVIRGQSAFNQPGRWQHQHQPTRSDGRFQVIAPEGHAVVLLCISGVAGYQRVEIPANADTTLNVVMPGGTSLVGQVESAGGAPVAGTLVVLEKHEMGAKQGHVMVLRLATKTNDEGLFRMPPLHGEFACFLANASLSNELTTNSSIFAARAAPLVAPIRVSLGGLNPQQEIKLREGRTVLLSGTVRYEDGRPAGGIRIKVYSGGARLGTPISGKDGRYSIRIPAAHDRVNLSAVGTQDHHPTPAQHAPGEHQNSFLILPSLTEDITNADYVMTSRKAIDEE